MTRTEQGIHSGRANYRASARWRGAAKHAVLAAALAMAGTFPADAQSTGGTSGSSSSTTTPATSGGNGSGGVGVGITIDLSHVFSRGSHKTRPANEWNNLNTKPDPDGGHEIVVYRPDVPDGNVSGVRVRVENSPPQLDGGDWVVNWKPEGANKASKPDKTVHPMTPEGKPCPPQAEVDQLKAQNQALQKQIDALNKENTVLRAAANQRESCKDQVKICEGKLAEADEEIAQLQKERDEAEAATQESEAAKAKAEEPGEGAKAIFIPFAVTYDGEREIDHSGWDVIRAVFDGNRIRVENHTEEWLAAHPGGPKDQDDWLRNNYGTIPTGQIDFGSASFGGQTLRQRIEHLCEPPPSLDEVEHNKSVAHELAIHYNGQSQQVTASSNGQSIAVSNPNVKEGHFDLDFSAECLWTYDEKTGELKKQTTIQLAVQYQDKNGKTHEVKYVADDPQLGWLMKS